MERHLRHDHFATTGDHAWTNSRLPSGRFRRVTVSALLAWGVAAVMLAFQSQTVVPQDQTSATPGAPSDAEFYLKRGEDFSRIHDDDRVIAEYTTAIRLNPDYAEAPLLTLQIPPCPVWSSMPAGTCSAPSTSLRAVGPSGN